MSLRIGSSCGSRTVDIGACDVVVTSLTFGSAKSDLEGFSIP